MRSREPFLDDHIRISTTAAIHIFWMLRRHMADEDGNLAESSGAVQAGERTLFANICAEMSVTAQVRAGLCAGTSSKCHGESSTFAIRSLGCRVAQMARRCSISIFQSRRKRTREQHRRLYWLPGWE